MKVRRVKFAFVSAAFLAAFATSCGAAYASSNPQHNDTTRAGFAALQKGDAPGAISLFTVAIESRTLQPEMLANALLNRALAYQHTGDDGLAIDDYTAALSVDAMSTSLRATALYNRGVARQKQGDLSIAIQDFTSALLLNPHFAQAFYSRGNALRDSGQLLFALSDYERALRFKHPDVARVHYGSAMTYIALRRPQDAKRSLANALAVNPEYAAAKEQLQKLGGKAEAASAEIESDPILTGSVAAYSGGTNAKKQVLPKAVDVPATLTAEPAAKTKSKKKYLDRLPMLEQASYVAASTAPVATAKPAAVAEEEIVIEVEEVPAIPEAQSTASISPVTPSKALKKKPVLAAPSPVAEVVAPEPDVAEIAPEEAVEEPAKASGWMVQLASADSENAAWSTWKKMQKKHVALRELSPIVVKADLGEKIVYRVRLHGFENQGGAKEACSDLKKKGLACYVSKS